MPRKQTIQFSARKPAAKLDIYDYHIIYQGGGKEGLDIIRIKVGSNRDVRIADISGDIVAHEKRIYVEGKRYWYLTGFMTEIDRQTYYDIHVRRQYEGDY